MQFLNALKDNPDAPASSAVSPQAYRANSAIFEGRTVADVDRLFAAKFEGSANNPMGSMPSYYAPISGDQRAAFYNQAKSAAAQNNTAAETAFQTAVQNNLSQTSTIGETQALKAEQFASVYGPVKGAGTIPRVCRQSAKRRG